MKRIQEIEKLLNISEELAYQVLNEMFLLDIDFSQCTQREFNRTAKEAHSNILAIV